MPIEPNDIRVLTRQLLALETDVDVVRTMIANGVRREWEELAGTAVDEMLADRTTAEDYLNHGDSRFRRAALSVLFFHWNATETLRAACERLAFDDSDSAVRMQAFSTFIACYANTSDRRVAGILAEVVCDDLAGVDQRRLAYEGLFIVGGLPIESWPVPGQATARLSEWVDWKFVNSFRMGGEKHV